MKFYDSLGLPNPDRVRIALAQKGVLDRVKVSETTAIDAHFTQAAQGVVPETLKGRP